MTDPKIAKEIPITFLGVNDSTFKIPPKMNAQTGIAGCSKAELNGVTY